MWNTGEAVSGQPWDARQFESRCMNVTIIDCAQNTFLSTAEGQRCAGRIAVEHAIARTWKQSSENNSSSNAYKILITKDSGGKPHAVVQSGTYRQNVAISISHAFPYALGAASMGEVLILGADVERVRDFSPAMRSVFLTPRERIVLRTKPRDNRFWVTLCWSLKEAALKALGVGLRAHPSRIDVSSALKVSGTSTIHIDKTEYASKIWWQSIDNNKYVMAIVALPKICTIQYRTQQTCHESARTYCNDNRRYSKNPR